MTSISSMPHEAGLSLSAETLSLQAKQSQTEGQLKTDMSPADASQLSLDTQVIHSHEAELRKTLLLSKQLAETAPDIIPVPSEGGSSSATVPSLAVPSDPIANIKALMLEQDDPLLIKMLGYLIEDMDKLNALESLPERTIHGERYSLCGNCSYEEAEIRGFAERHSLAATLDPVRWSFLHQACSDKDLAYIEGSRAGERISQAEHPSSEPVLHSKKCFGWEPKETIEWEEEYLALLSTQEALKQMEERLAKEPKSKTSLFIMFSQLDLWNLITNDNLESLLHRTMETRIPILKTIREEELHREVTAALWDTIAWLAQKMDQSIDATWEIRQNSLLHILSSDEGTTKYVVAGMNHFPTPLNQNNSLLEKTRAYFASKKHCVLISEQILADQVRRVETMKQEIIQLFPSMMGRI